MNNMTKPPPPPTTTRTSSKKKNNQSFLVGCGTVLILLLTSPKYVTAVAPNIPGYEKACNCTWENVHQYRKRLGINYKYNPHLISPELCRTISEEECEALDKSMIDEARNKRKMLETVKEQRRTQRRNLQRVESVGVVKVLVVLLQWSDHGDRDLLSKEDVETLFMSDDVDDEANILPSGSVKRYFEVGSYNQLTVDATVTDWIMTDNTEDFYSQFGDRGRDPGLQEAFRLPLETLDDQRFDFDSFDTDFSGVIDLTVFFHSGYDGVLGSADCNNNRPSSQRIASHASSAINNLDWVSANGIELGAYVVASAYRGACNFNIARLGILVHEMIHPFGMPDLYDGDGPLDPSSGNIGGLDRYDNMANPFGQGNTQAFPGHLSAWSKIFLGWVEPMEINLDGTFRARPLETHPDVYKITHNYPDGEYLLIENRQGIPLDFDQNMFDPGGILIYHVDENVPFDVADYNRERGYPEQGDWPINGKHYAVALLQADGLYELEQSINGGHSADFYNTPEQELGPGNGDFIAFDRDFYPNTDTYANAEITQTGITINNFIQVPGTDPIDMTFDVIGIAQATPAPTTAPSGSPSINATEIASAAPTFQGTFQPGQNVTNGTVTSAPSLSPINGTTNGTVTSAPTVSPINGTTNGTVTSAPTVSPINGTTNETDSSLAPTMVEVEISAAPSVRAPTIGTTLPPLGFTFPPIPNTTLSPSETPSTAEPTDAPIRFQQVIRPRPQPPRLTLSPTASPTRTTLAPTKPKTPQYYYYYYYCDEKEENGKGHSKSSKGGSDYNYGQGGFYGKGYSPGRGIPNEKDQHQSGGAGGGRHRPRSITSERGRQQPGDGGGRHHPINIYHEPKRKKCKTKIYRPKRDPYKRGQYYGRKRDFISNPQVVEEEEEQQQQQKRTKLHQLPRVEFSSTTGQFEVYTHGPEDYEGQHGDSV